MTIVKCKICGAEQEVDHYCNDERDKLVSNQMCFKCNHWRMNHELDLTERKNHKYAIINGKHYVLGDGNSVFKGMGGSKFKILFNDGVVKETNDLWHQGNIEEAHPHWREVMPDNAVFIKDQGYNYCS